jgi:hypothetical protein
MESSSFHPSFSDKQSASPKWAYFSGKWPQPSGTLTVGIPFLVASEHLLCPSGGSGPSPGVRKPLAFSVSSLPFLPRAVVPWVTSSQAAIFWNLESLFFFSLWPELPTLSCVKNSASPLSWHSVRVLSLESKSLRSDPNSTSHPSCDQGMWNLGWHRSSMWGCVCGTWHRVGTPKYHFLLESKKNRSHLFESKI